MREPWQGLFVALSDEGLYSPEPGSNAWLRFRFGGPGTIRQLNLSSWAGCVSDGMIGTQIPGQRAMSEFDS